ncbi:hypothetical protein BOX15_Mlig015867g1 [Macrostomum lignano]|uniref:Uncharacterized protein n=2 Tax=Macrostomum lignano TaxID=282301 RepID=A0A267ENY4_9PLAT|nr:hypothetical protein BOX15_Mlig015867g1 [Macrostomum lignano]
MQQQQLRLPVDLPNWPDLRKILLILRHNDGKTSTLMRSLDLLQSCFVGGGCGGDLMAASVGIGRSRSSCFAGLGRFLETSLRPDERRQFFSSTLPFIVDRVLALETHRETLNYSRQSLPVAVLLSRSFISSLIASAFLCLMPPHPPELLDSMSDNSFAPFFAGILSTSSYQAEKLRCILAYFEELQRRSTVASQLETDDEKLLIVRSVLEPGLLLGSDYLASSSQPLCPVLLDPDAPIDQADTALLHVNFSSCLLGGSTLRTGVAQEEVNFCVHPELLVTQLFMEAMESNESVFVFGYEPFSSYTGSGVGFRFSGRLSEMSSPPFDRCLVCMDALPFIWCQHEQYYECNLMRELNKAFVGFRQSFAHIPKQAPQPADQGPLSMLELAAAPSPHPHRRPPTQAQPQPPHHHPRTPASASASTSGAVVIDWTNRRRSSGAASSASSSTPSWQQQRGSHSSSSSSASRRSSSRNSSQVNASELEEFLQQGGRRTIAEEAIIEADVATAGNGGDYHSQEQPGSNGVGNSSGNNKVEPAKPVADVGLGSSKLSTMLQRRRNSSPLRRPPSNGEQRRRRRRRLSARRDSSPAASPPLVFIDDCRRRREAATATAAAALLDSLLRQAMLEAAAALAANAATEKTKRNNRTKKKKPKHQSSLSSTARAYLPSGDQRQQQLFSVDACGNLAEPRLHRLAGRVADRAVASALLVLRHRALCPSQACCQRRHRQQLSHADQQAELAFVDAVDGLASRMAHRIVAQAVPEAARTYSDSLHCHELASLVPRGVATGNWGCDSSGGDPQLKSLLQWMAASLNQLPVYQYHSLGNSRMGQFDELSNQLQAQAWSVGRLWQQVQAYSQVALKEQERLERVETSLFAYLLAQLSAHAASE